MLHVYNDQKNVIAQLSKVQRLACLEITGAISTKPTAALDTLLNLPPLLLIKQSKAKMGAYKL